MRAAMIKAFGEPAEVLELVDVPESTGPVVGEVLVASSTRRSLLRFRKVGP
jgi:NADPH:quinone reductase-like Zn-dependent oxidoreductase